MKINTKKIEGYENMSLEEKLAALEGYEMEGPDYSGYIKKETFDKTASELADLKKKTRQAMDESDRVKLEQEEMMNSLQARVKELEGEKQISEYKAALTGLGYDAKKAAEAAQAMSMGDMQKVFAIQKSFLEDREQAIKTELLKSTPTPPGGGVGGASVTKEQFNNMGYSERAQLFNDNPELYAELNK